MVDSTFDDFEKKLDMHDIFNVIRKRFRLILGTFLIAVFVVGIVSFLTPPTYEAESNLRIKQPNGLANSLLSDTPNTSVNDQLMSTYAEILKGHTVIDVVMAKTQPKTLRYEEMLKRITVSPLKDTEILKIKVQAKSAKEAKQVTNILVDTFLERLTRLAQSEQTMVSDFIGKRLVEATQGLAQAEGSLEKYKREQQIVAPEDETKALVDRLSSINQLKAENTVNLAAAQAKLEATNKELSQGKSELVTDSPLIGQYKARLAELEVKLAGLLANLTEKDPEVVATRAELDETRTNLNTVISQVVNSEATSMTTIRQNLLQSKLQAEAEMAASNAQVNAINKITATNETEIFKLPAKEQELARLMRDTSLAQEIYVMLTKRNEEARLSKIMQPTDVQIIDRPVLPDNPIKPNKLFNMLIAGFLGLFVGIALAFFWDYFNTTIITVDDVKNYLHLPVLGNIPDFDKWSPKDNGIKNVDLNEVI